MLEVKQPRITKVKYHLEFYLENKTLNIEFKECFDPVKHLRWSVWRNNLYLTCLAEF